MKKQKKGCVYFFKHTGLKPIKIGYTNNESPINRFNQFKTYAPFGAEIIGFIKTTEAKEIETKLHLKYSSFRLDGEWFEISESQIKTEIDFYTSKEETKLKNNFQIAWAKSLDVKKESVLVKLDQEKVTKYEAFKILYKDTKSATKLSKKLKVSRSMIYKYIKKTK